jgi:uncharacterized protein YegL
MSSSNTEPAGNVKAKCLPTYLLLDTSGSMLPFADTLNKTLDHLYDTVVKSPRVSEFAHISIISFNTSAHVVLPMMDIEQVTALPEVMCGGGTRYGDAFSLVHERIDVDVPALNDAGRAVLRPAVFFLTDGNPTDEEGSWTEAYSRLVDPTWRRRPHVITYGFGAANSDILGRIATKAAFLADEQLDQQEALAGVLSSMLQSLVTSARADQLLIPTDVPGFISVPVEYTD